MYLSNFLPDRRPIRIQRLLLKNWFSGDAGETPAIRCVDVPPARTVFKLERASQRFLMGFAVLVIGNLFAATATFADTKTAIDSVRQIGAEGAGFPDARRAVDELRELPSERVFEIFEAMRDADPVAENWFRGIAADIVRRSGPPSLENLESYLNDTTQSDSGRAAAMSLLETAAPKRFATWLKSRLDDPSLLIRERAVAAEMQRLDQASDEPPETVTVQLLRVLESARHPTQVSTLIKKLSDAGDPVTTASAFAMIQNWYSIGPFDNREGIGFDETYGPETTFRTNGRVNLEETFAGKDGVVRWQPITTTGDEGVVDLAGAYDKEKGAVAYVYARFESATERDAQARLGCICANQVWINGKRVMSNEVYHAGSMIDQYVGDCQLVKGTNRILLKICQNEQTESWAQEWEFQFRLTDPTGKGLRADP